MNASSMTWHDHIRTRASTNLRIKGTDRLAPLVLTSVRRQLDASGIEAVLSVEDVRSWLAGAATPVNEAIRLALYDALQFNPKNKVALETLYLDTPMAQRISYAMVEPAAQEKPAVPAPAAAIMNDEAGMEASLTLWNARRQGEKEASGAAQKPRYSMDDARRDWAALDAGTDTAVPTPATAAPKPTISGDKTRVTTPSAAHRVTKEAYLRCAREALGMSMQEVADATGLAKETVKGIEYAKGNPAGPAGLKLADYFSQKQKEVIAQEVAGRVPESSRRPLFFDRGEFDTLDQEFSAARHAAKHRLLAEKRKNTAHDMEGQGRG